MLGRGFFRGPNQDAMLKFAPILILLVVGFGAAVLVMDFVQSRREPQASGQPSSARIFPANKNELLWALSKK